MKITALISNFRAGLIGLLPSIVRVGIPWKRPDAYDDWDELTSSLYKLLVVDVVRWAVPMAEQEGFRLPDYDLLLPTYDGLSLIEVLPSAPAGTLRIFHALGTIREPFDIVEWRSISLGGIPQSEALGTSPADEVELRLRLVGPGGTISLLDEIDLQDKET